MMVFQWISSFADWLFPGYRFLYPSFLFLLLVPLVLLFWKGRKGKSSAIQFSGIATLKRAVGGYSLASKGILSALRILSLMLLIIALARPQKGSTNKDIEASGIDIVLLVDMSGSMESLDFELHGQQANRLDVVKAVVAKFIDERTNDRLGLIAFSGYPYLVSPLTLDHDWLQKRLASLTIGTTEDGTAIGSGIASAVNRLRTQPGKSKIIILLTDGINNSGKVPPLAAAEAAEALGIKIYTIGAGSRGEARIPVTDQFGNRRYATAKVDIDEATLIKIATMTGGEYFRATDTTSLQKIYERINTLEQTKRVIHKFERFDELFTWAAIPALLLLVLEAGLSRTVYRTLP